MVDLERLLGADRLLARHGHDRALIETDPAKRAEMYVRMQDLMEESGAYVFLTHELNAAIYRDDIEPGLLPDGTVRFAEFQLAKG